uniref:Vitellogenin domain-containing protein n=1 Tax=Anopheles culicifacies TaxID=139723 RepID=A0A182LUT4_9DIPT
MFKIFALLAFLAIVAATDYYDEYDNLEYYPQSKYKFDYDVKDVHTDKPKTQPKKLDSGSDAQNDTKKTKHGVEYKSDNSQLLGSYSKELMTFPLLVFRGNSSHGCPNQGFGSEANNYNNVFCKYY